MGIACCMAGSEPVFGRIYKNDTMPTRERWLRAIDFTWSSTRGMVPARKNMVSLKFA